MNDSYTHIAIVLDSSGSMRSVLADTIGGFNTFIDDQKKLPGKANVTLATFSDAVHFLDDGPIEGVATLTPASYWPCGNTALFDAIGQTIHRLGGRFENMAESERPKRVVVVIITDGYENVSREYTAKQVADMIEHQRTKYSWEFVFIGANQDAILTAKTLNIAAGSALTYAANSGGTKAAFRSISASAAAYRSGVVGQMAFSDEDRKLQAEQGAAT